MLLAVVVLFIVAAAAAWWRLPALHPAQLWLTVWSIVLAGFGLHLLPYSPLADTTLALIVLCSAAFVAAAYAAGRLTRVSPRPSPIAAWHVEWAAAVLVAMALVGCALFVAQAVRDAGLRDALLTSSAVRQSVREGAYALTVKYVYFAFAAAAMCGVAAGEVRAHRWGWAAAACAMVLSIYFATGRATLVVAGIAAVVGYLMAADVHLRGRRLLTAGALAGLAPLIIFLGMGQLIGKTFENSELTTVRSVFTEHRSTRILATPYMYMTAPIGALNALVQRPPPDRSEGCAMLSAVCGALSHAGLDTRPTPAIRPFTASPIPWNTYTAIDDGIRDFGYAGAPFVFAALGLVCGTLWALARARRRWAIAVYAVLSTAIVVSAGSNTFAAAHVLGAIVLMLLSLAAAMMLARAATR